MTIDMSETFALHLFMSFPQLFSEKGKPISLKHFKNTIIMESFDFYLDTKVTMWRREKFSIEAETINEARGMAIEAVKNGETHKYDPDYENLYDTSESMSVEENDGCPTLELFSNGSDNFFWENTQLTQNNKNI